MRVILTYFYPTGIFYTAAAYETNETELSAIYEEVKRLRSAAQLPGLHLADERYLIVLIEVKDAARDVPRLLLPEEKT